MRWGGFVVVCFVVLFWGLVVVFVFVVLKVDCGLV